MEQAVAKAKKAEEADEAKAPGTKEAQDDAEDRHAFDIEQKSPK